MTWHGRPILDVQHPALAAKTGVRTGTAWRDRSAARAAGLRCYDDWADLPRDVRLTIVAEYEIAWRIEALQAWEQKPRRNPPKASTGHGRRHQ